MVPSTSMTQRTRRALGAGMLLACAGTLGAVCWWRGTSVLEGAQRMLRSRRLMSLRMPWSRPPKQYPIVMMHGLTASELVWGSMVSWINAISPDRKVFPLSIYDNKASYTSLIAQLPDLAQTIRSLADQNPEMKDGYDLLCHSQGALLCRCLVEYMNDHQVRRLISLAGPQMGVYGKEMEWGDMSKNMVLDADFGNLAFSHLMQMSNSVANMWNDPTRPDSFVKGNLFISLYNGLKDDPAHNARRKYNFLKLEKAVFLVGDTGKVLYEGGIVPWQSGVFGFYKDGSSTEIIPMEETEVFKRDTFGLKTLKETDRLVLHAVPGVEHNQWLTDRAIFEKYVWPHLHLKDSDAYILGEANSISCPSSYEKISSKKVCHAAGQALGIQIGDWNGGRTDTHVEPTGCFQNRNGDVYFNTAAKGGANKDCKPICKKA